MPHSVQTPIVLLEAASAGRPVLASNIPGCRETFEDEVTGFGFEPRNILDLYKTIEKFIFLSYEKKKQMGEAGRQKMEREFNREKVVAIYVNEIMKLVKFSIEE